MVDLTRLHEANHKRISEEQKAKKAKEEDTKSELRSIAVRKTIVESVKSLAEHQDKSTYKTTIVNKPEVRSPDVTKSVNEMSDEISNKLTELIQKEPTIINQTHIKFAGGINYKGQYSPKTTYETGDGVTYNGSYYIASKETKASPESKDDWSIVVSKGEKGDIGRPPTDEELTAIIKPLIPAPVPGKDGHTPTVRELMSIVRPLIPAPVKGQDGKDAVVDYEKIVKEAIKLIPKPKDGKDGARGPKGQGIRGPKGEGVPYGGTTSQALVKKTDYDFDTEWHTLSKSDVGLSNVDNTSDATKNSATATLSNKTLDNSSTITLKDNKFTLQDDSDTTKQIQFQLSGITTATTRTITVPNASGTMLLRSDTATVQNKNLDNTNSLTIQDINLTIQDDADNTRQAKFNASSISAGTTRTLSLPNVSDTLVARGSTDTLTNKTIDGSSNTLSNINASSLTQNINAQTDSYTLLTADTGKLVTVNKATAVNVTVDGSLGLSAGQKIDIAQLGAGQITIVASGTTVNGTPTLKLRTQYSACTIICLSSNNYLVIGDMASV